MPGVRSRQCILACRRRERARSDVSRGDVGIVLSLGTTDRYCAQFGGDNVKNDGDGTKRKNAPASGACP